MKAQSKKRLSLEVKPLPKRKVLNTCRKPSNCQ